MSFGHLAHALFLKSETVALLLLFAAIVPRMAAGISSDIVACCLCRPCPCSNHGYAALFLLPILTAAASGTRVLPFAALFTTCRIARITLEDLAQFCAKRPLNKATQKKREL